MRYTRVLRELDSWSGPTGDFEREDGEALFTTTSSSKLRLSFLSRPASLPAPGQGEGQGGAVVQLEQPHTGWCGKLVRRNVDSIGRQR
jgi:hypothetical protein